jgi:hypothetical protein
MAITNNPNRPYVPNQTANTTMSVAEAPQTAEEKKAEADKKAENEAAFQRAQKKQLAQNNAISRLLEDESNFLPNVLSEMPMSNYRFRLFMTTERDIMDRVTSYDTQEIYKIIDAIPKITIAETGVTAGINIESVEINQMTAPGWRTRSSYSSSFEIVITEPVGSSLLESMIISAQDLNVQNYMKFWYFLELTFIGYNENGDVNYNPCEKMDLDNGGRWIYQISISNIKTNIDVAGARHILTCMPYDMEGFNDETCGRIPEKLNIGGNTVKTFLDDLAAKLTRAWDEMYAGEIYKFKIKARSIVTSDKEYDPNNFVLSPDLTNPEHSPIRNIPFSQGTSNQYISAEIPRGATLTDIITAMYAHCESMQMLMLDTSTPLDIEDEGGLYKGKKYRLAVVPVIEPEIKITGYDPITGNYMKEVTYHIWGFRTLGANLAPSQYENTSDEQVTTDMVQTLLDNNYLKKKYEYRFTGMNTEVINLDTEFNFAFSSLLPQLGGWRTKNAAVTDHEKHNPSSAINSGTYSDQKKNVELSPSEIRKKLSGINGEISNLTSEMEATTDEAKKTEIQGRIANLEQQRTDLRFNANQIRTDTNLENQIQMDRMKDVLPLESYAEDFDKPFALPYIATYNQRAGEDYAAGSGYAAQWHRGASLVGALYNQQYAPLTNAMINITMDIKGDPYWLGYSSIERRVLLNAEGVRARNLPNFAEGDNTFAFNFRFPLKVGDDGNLIIRPDDVFLGVYRVTNVVSRFDKGEFKQTLTAIKLELIAPVLKKKGSSEEGTTSGT